MMKPFYSIIYVKPETASEEKIAVGLFMNTGSKPLFDFSGEKLKTVSRLMDRDVVESVEKMLKNVKRKISSISDDKNQTEAFEVSPFTDSYFEYLNRYSNNLLVYSDPSKNIGNFSVDDFEPMFRLFVDREYGIEKIVNKSFKESVRETLYKSLISEKVDISYRIPKNTIKTIYRSHEVDYIGYNGSIISGNSVDTNSDSYVLENKIYLLRVLVDGLLDLAKSLKMKNEGKHIIFYNEPEGRKQKDILHDAINDDTSPLFLKPWDAFKEEERWINENRIRKFSELDV